MPSSRCLAVLSMVLVGCAPPVVAPDGGSPADAGTDAVDAGSTTDAGPRDAGGSTPVDPLAGRGLLFPDGIEPGNPSDCEAPTGNTCYWVDAQAPDGGNGTFASPFNSFELVAGYDEGSGYVAGLISGGDFLYVKGTFDGTANVERTHKTKLELARASQGGTKAAPTVIKSWRGSPRAVFDGAEVESDLIHVRNSGGVRLQNLEVARSGGRGVYIGEGVAFAEVVSLFVRDGLGDGVSGDGGGLLLRLTDMGTHEYVVRSSQFSNNRVRQSGPEGNIGAISILMEPLSPNGGTVRVFDNLIENEVGGLRQKHTGNVHVEAYNNLLRGCTLALHVRALTNDFHHNLIVDSAEGLGQDSWNYHTPTMHASVHSNTFFNVRTLLALSMEYPMSPGFDVQRTFELRDNLVLNTTASTRAMIAFSDIDGALTSNTVIRTANNLYWYTPQSTPFVLIPLQMPSSRDFAWAAQAYQDVGSFFADPQLVDPQAGDFHLAPGSPALGRGTGGINIGAL